MNEQRHSTNRCRRAAGGWWRGGQLDHLIRADGFCEYWFDRGSVSIAPDCDADLPGKQVVGRYGVRQCVIPLLYQVVAGSCIIW